MLEDALNFICDEFNNYLPTRLTGADNDELQMFNVSRLQDTDSPDTPPKILLTIVNVEEDRISKNPENFFKNGNKVEYANPAVHLNLYLLFTINTSYEEAVKRLSRIILFFQSNNVFTHSNSPSLPASIDKLIFDLYTMNFEQVNHLWASLGGRMMPSVLYKMRLISMNDNRIQAEGGLIQEIDINGEMMMK